MSPKAVKGRKRDAIPKAGVPLNPPRISRHQLYTTSVGWREICRRIWQAVAAVLSGSFPHVPDPRTAPPPLQKKKKKKKSKSKSCAPKTSPRGTYSVLVNQSQTINQSPIDSTASGVRDGLGMTPGESTVPPQHVAGDTAQNRPAQATSNVRTSHKTAQNHPKQPVFLGTQSMQHIENPSVRPPESG